MMRAATAALTGLALFSALPADAASKRRPSASPRPAAAATVPAPIREPSAEAARVMSWIGRAKDNGALPYAVIDKKAARLFLFDAKGQLRGETAVLVGIALGDEATPGVGAKNLAEIGPAEKTTPAGRFLARYGVAAGNQRVLWVDYHTSVALHPVPTANPRERRRARLLSPSPDDNRITFGCINVSQAFYSGSVQPLFRRKGGVVYVLPDIKPLEEVFPRLRVEPFLNGGT